MTQDELEDVLYALDAAEDVVRANLSGLKGKVEALQRQAQESRELLSKLVAAYDEGLACVEPNLVHELNGLMDEARTLLGGT